MKRRITILLTLAVLSLGIVTAGCGSASKYVGGVAAHHIANHVSPQHKRTINKAFCAYHLYRAYKDFKAHHKLVAAANAYSAYKACKAGFIQKGSP